MGRSRAWPLAEPVVAGDGRQSWPLKPDWACLTRNYVIITSAMKVAIVPIGNSRGVRLPKTVLDQLGFGAEAELAVEDGRVTLTPLKSPRRGWAEAFAKDP